MRMFEELKEHVTVAYCKKCNRTDSISVSGEALWCSWCSQKCEVSHKSLDVVPERALNRLFVNSDGSTVNLNDIPVQPLRIPMGWKVAIRNHFFEVDPTPLTVKNLMLFNRTMVVLVNEDKKRLLDIGWTDEMNFEGGEYYFDLYEGGYRGEILRSYRNKNRIEFVGEVETVLDEVSRKF